MQKELLELRLAVLELRVHQLWCRSERDRMLLEFQESMKASQQAHRESMRCLDEEHHYLPPLGPFQVQMPRQRQ